MDSADREKGPVVRLPEYGDEAMDFIVRIQ
jgi:hypothetical protein